MELLFPERSFRRVHAAGLAQASAQVVVRPSLSGHEARVMVLSPRPGERVIFDPEPSCRGLSDALAVAFAMLIEAQAVDEAADTRAMASASAVAQASSQPPSSAAESPNGSSSPQAPKAVVTPHKPKKSENRRLPKSAESQVRSDTAVNAGASATGRQRAWTTHARGGVIAGLGILSEPTVGTRLGLDLFHRSGFGVELSGLGMWALPAQGDQGSISVRRLGAMLDLCFERGLWRDGRYSLCAELGFGAQIATTTGYTVVYATTNRDPWITLGPKFGYLHELTEWLSAFVSVGASTDLIRNNYLVDTRREVPFQPLGFSTEIGFRLAGPRF